MRDTLKIKRWRAARDWPLLGALLAISLGVAIGIADLIYRMNGALFYPSLALVNYSLRGLPAQLPALASMTLGLLAVWVGIRRQSRAWMATGVVLLALSLAGLVVARSPYRPVAGVSVGDQAYRLVSFRADDREADLLLLFACEPRGMLCHQVSAYAPFDVATGRHVAGTPELRASASAHTITLRVGDSIIGMYVMGAR